MDRVNVKNAGAIEDQAKEKLELIEYVDKRIDANSARDRELIKYTITTVLGIVGTIITIVTILIAIVGVKTFSDVGQKVDELTTATIKKRIDSYDVEQRYQSDLDRLYAQQIINRGC